MQLGSTEPSRSSGVAVVAHLVEEIAVLRRATRVAPRDTHPALGAGPGIRVTQSPGVTLLVDRRPRQLVQVLLAGRARVRLLHEDPGDRPEVEVGGPSGLAPGVDIGDDVESVERVSLAPGLRFGFADEPTVLQEAQPRRLVGLGDPYGLGDAELRRKASPRDLAPVGIGRGAEGRLDIVEADDLPGPLDPDHQHPGLVRAARRSSLGPVRPRRSRRAGTRQRNGGEQHAQPRHEAEDPHVPPPRVADAAHSTTSRPPRRTSPKASVTTGRSRSTT